VALIAACANVPPVSDSCANPQLVWSTWSAEVLEANAEGRFVDIEGDGLARVVAGYNALLPRTAHSPDSAYVFMVPQYMPRIILVFVTSGCVTMTQPMTMGDLLTLMMFEPAGLRI